MVINVTARVLLCASQTLKSLNFPPAEFAILLLRSERIPAFCLKL